ncbi:C1 family peptidase [Methylobacterium aerolatum]|uniref:Peptidase C1A papain C-terminal domain-containing protein n=1 Tax=Methylobacterium aerolatum TaxID=418708 RepID=A0ABU0I1X1_9HYPH|nr:C1 family peptidase [Methylobacterium aerolatum]MDQ0448590.1 hypothetical protein [Methylobacterium aerolatum]GJD33205.1 hypothetical protein FMGBMHLM_0091 [Methylobacterium aerolatum]
MLRGLASSVLAIACIVSATATCAVGQPVEAEEQQGTGSQPLSPEEFAKLPKTPEYRAFLPGKTDLASHFPRPGSQGNQGSCVGWAVGYAARGYYSEAAEGRNVHEASNIPSPSYIYNNIIPNKNQCDSGASIVSALNLLRVSGSPSIKNYPYNPSKCSAPGSDKPYQTSDFKIDRWLAVDYRSLDQVKGELAKGHPVIVSLRSTKEFHKLRRGQIYQVVGAQGDVWHAVSIVGYDERRQAFKFINSWGEQWGDQGFGWISYASFQSEVREAYVMRPLKPVVPERKETPVPSPPVVQIKPPTPTPAPTPVVHIDPKPLPTPTPVPVAEFKCGHVEGKRQGEKVTFSGFVGSDGDLLTLSERAQAMNADVNVAVRPWPQCEVLLTLEKALAQADRPKVKIEGIGKGTQEGDYLRITVESPAYPSFIHAAYIQADGSVVHLIQPDNLHLKAVPPSDRMVFGALDGTGPKFKVAPPFGREMLVVLASRSPLFASPRPTQETEREFLTALRKALAAKPDPTAPDRVVSAGVDAIITSKSSVIPAWLALP